MSPTKKMGQKPVQSSWLSPKATNKNRQRALSLDTGAKYLCFFSSRSLKTREKYISFAHLLLLSTFYEGSLFTFRFLNDKIHSYVFFFT
jgi:hypothetical protein